MFHVQTRKKINVIEIVTRLKAGSYFPLRIRNGHKISSPSNFHNFNDHCGTKKSKNSLNFSTARNGHKIYENKKWGNFMTIAESTKQARLNKCFSVIGLKPNISDM